MLRRLLALLMILLLPTAVLADEYSPYEVCTFSGSLPERLRGPLADWVEDESRILSSGVIQRNGGQHDEDCYSALILLDTSDGARLIAAAQPEGLPWQVNDYTYMLRDRRNASISIYQPEVSLIPVFSIDYYVSDGLVSDLISFWNDQLWCVYGHIDKPRNVRVMNDHGSLDFTGGIGPKDYACPNPFYLDYMSSITEFPVTREAAKALADTVAQSTPIAGDIVYARGANLRKEPTSKSESLGVYAANVPMHFTGETSQGSAWPWYQVRIGDTLGWMSSNYIAAALDPGCSPISLGCTTKPCPMYAHPGDTQPILQLEAGPSFYILAEYHDMYHICIPQDCICWAVDVDGTYGYIPKEDVLTGASISALYAMESTK